MPKPNIHIFKDKDAVAKAFADFLVDWMENRPKATIALSGGSTPNVLFKLMADQYKNQLPWEKIHFFWGDERCVPPTDEESNYKTANELLLKHLSIPEENIHRVKGEAKPEEEAIRYGKEIEEYVDVIDSKPAFDLIILGMGGDGHTASIFPNQMELLTEPSICVVAQHPETGQQRVSLTGTVINNAKHIAFLVTGTGKKEKVAAIINKEENFENYPAAHIEPANGELSWYLDVAAATGIST